MRKQSLDQRFKLSDNLSTLHDNCRINSRIALETHLRGYEQAIQAEIKIRLEGFTFDPATQEITPDVYNQFVDTMGFHLLHYFLCFNQLKKMLNEEALNAAANAPVPLPEPGNSYRRWGSSLTLSGLEKCKVPAKEMERRNRQWYERTVAQVAGGAVLCFVPTPLGVGIWAKVAWEVARIGLGTVGTTALNTTMAAVDNIQYGAPVSHELDTAAVDGLWDGFSASIVGDVGGAVWGRLFPASAPVQREVPKLFRGFPTSSAPLPLPRANPHLPLPVGNEMWSFWGKAPENSVHEIDLFLAILESEKILAEKRSMMERSSQEYLNNIQETIERLNYFLNVLKEKNNHLDDIFSTSSSLSSEEIASHILLACEKEIHYLNEQYKASQLTKMKNQSSGVLSYFFSSVEISSEKEDLSDNSNKIISKTL